jgi:hypothetical protein
MCYSCYEEYGKPSIINEKTKHCSALIDSINYAGGHAHAVIDDFNFEDSDIDFCLKECTKDSSDMFTRERLAIQVKLLTLMKSLTFDERVSALAINEGWIGL